MSSRPLAQTHARRRVSPVSSLSTIRRCCALALDRIAALSPGRSTGTTSPPPSFSTRPGKSILTDFGSKGALTTGKHGRRWTGKRFKKETNKHRRQVAPIDVLPDDVLLEIFYIYISEAQSIQAWQCLVHVYSRWRSVVFESPRRLDLRLVCTNKTPARDTLDVWPTFPLLIQDCDDLEEGLDNIVAVLERSDRVRVIDLEDVSSSQLEKLSAAMQEPFPELTGLWLSSDGEVVLPDSFLGGSAPRLQFLWLNGIPFPGLPKRLLSATHLVRLYLGEIPHSGYISPEAMVTALSTTTRLNSLSLGFQSPRSRPDRETRHLHPPTRSVFSVLTDFSFKGDNEYLDDLVALMDAPRLKDLYITFFNDIVFDTPQLIKFICRTPRLKAFEKASVTFDGGSTWVQLSSRTSGDDLLHVRISCGELDWQVLSMEQVCTSSLPPLSALDLYIYEGQSLQAHRQDNTGIENALWLELLQPFRSVKNLYLSETFAPRIVPALEELVGNSATEVLPTLETIFLEGSEPRVQKGIRQFVGRRQVTGDPVAVSQWHRRRD